MALRMLASSSRKSLFKPALLRSAAGHGLVVPYNHDPFVTLDKGIPTEQVRELVPEEKKWEFWTSSQSFYRLPPKTDLVSFVPPQESWVVERSGKFSRVLKPGAHVILPFLDSVKVVKPSVTAVAGVVSRNISSKNGATVDAYAVVQYKIVDPATSAYFKSVETGLEDSEYELPKRASKLIASEVAKLDVGSSGLTDAQKESVSAAVLAGLKTKSQEWGLEATSVELRGAFSTELSVPDKIRAYDAPPIDLDSPGHNLSNDYWSDVLTPPYFEKKRFGSNKIPKTPAAVTLEWSIPSPSDFHHFNHVPKMCVAPPEDVKKIAA